MEMVDIVNEKNEVIGSCSKEEAHKKGLLHRTVIAEIFNSKGEWLLVKQTPHKQEPGKYVSPMGGHVQSKESLYKTLSRELLEETGIRHYKSRFKGKFIYNVPIRDHIENHYYIVYEIISDDPIKLSDELCEEKWFTKPELKKAIKKTPEKFGKSFFAVIDCLYAPLFDRGGRTMA